MSDWTRLSRAVEKLDAPLALVDLDAFDANAQSLVDRARGVPIRVASKSIRVRGLLERVLAKPGFNGIMSYSLSEALWLYEHGVSDDILVAYPTTDRVALGQLASNPAARAAITIMVDSVAHLDFLDATLGEGHPTIRLILELDSSWRPIRGLSAIHVGTRRSPIFTPRQAGAFARAIDSRPGFELVGLMGYEGQIAGVGDNPASKLRGIVVRWMQRQSAAELSGRRAAVIAEVRKYADLAIINGGGTGSIESTSKEPLLTEVAAGSGLIGPTLFDSYASFHPYPAVQFALPVVRRPTPTLATLFSGGYVASGTGVKNRLPTPHEPQGLALLPTEGAGEVQTPIKGKAARALAIGDKVFLRHAKAGELAERFTHYQAISNGQHIADLPTYRGEGQAFG